MAVMAAITMAEPPKTWLTQPGMPGPVRAPLVRDTPMPSATESPAMDARRGVRPSFVSMRMPVMLMVPNTLMVAPPMTACGMPESTAASLGMRPAAMRMMAAVENTRRLMTRVWVTMPTFWPKDDVGMAPKNAPTMVMMPWETRPPVSSCTLGSRSMPPTVAPVKLPMVSSEATMNTMVMLAMDAGTNLMANGMKCGSSNQLDATTAS